MTSNKIMKETKVVNILMSGKKSEVSLILSNDKRKCLINAVFPNGENFDAESSDYFSALVYIRNKYPNYIFLCKGAKKNVYPSGMSRDMGGGVIAYELTLGKRAEIKDMVNIFDYDDDNVDCTPQQQQEFFNQWLISIRESKSK